MKTLYVSLTVAKVIRDHTQYRTEEAAKVGAAYLRMQELSLQATQSIAQSLNTQQQIVDDALRSLGIDLTKEQVTVAADGMVMRLVNGKYVPYTVEG